MSDYTAFVRETVDQLVAHQSVHVPVSRGLKPSSITSLPPGRANAVRPVGTITEGGGFSPRPALCLCVTRPVHRDHRSLGHLKPDGTHQTYFFPGLPMEMAPTLLDFSLWPVLQRLTALTGEQRYAELVEGMAAVFAKHGFDARSGLGFIGEEAGFDVVRLDVSSKKVNSPPHFKPSNSGPFPGQPLDVLWRHAPGQMHRMFRAMYLGLVTDPESMDFNRFCDYDFDDAAGEHAQVRNSGHCAFDSCAGRMIHWWASCFAETGDADCLDWASRMADKWAAVQHPTSGLVPNFFGAVEWQEHVPMPPGQWTETRGAALMAAGLLDAVGELRRRPEGKSLAGRLQDMALRLARGLAKYAYDADLCLFREHLHLDGRPYEPTARYCFRTAEEKTRAVERDPELAQVPVYAGAGFYRPGTYWEYCAGVNTPVNLAEAAAATGDAELAALMAPWAQEVVAASRREPVAMTPAGDWTFRASAYGIKMLVHLSHSAADADSADVAHYLQWAEEIADAELARLAGPVEGDWWRMPDRASLLDALLLLQGA